MPTVPSTTQKHFRIASDSISVRSAEDGVGATVSGHAAVFNVMSPPLWELGGACEMLLPGCFQASLADPNTICKLLINHDSNLVLASYPGTLALREDAVGLYFEATLGNQSYAKDLAESMRRGDLNKCSFAFQIETASMEMVDGQPCQVIAACNVSDTSIVAYPAYPTTDASLRSHYEGLIDNLKQKQQINTSERHTAAMDCHAQRKRETEILGLDD